MLSHECSHDVQGGGADRAYVLEPPDGREGRLKTGRKGVGRFRVTVRGRAAHAGSSPEEGVSAIQELAHQVELLFELNDPERGITVNVGTIDGGLRPNVVAPEAFATVDARAPTVGVARSVEEAILGLRPTRPGLMVDVEGSFGRPPMPRTERNRRSRSEHACWRSPSDFPSARRRSWAVRRTRTSRAN